MTRRLTPTAKVAKAVEVEVEEQEVPAGHIPVPGEHYSAETEQKVEAQQEEQEAEEQKPE